MNTYLKGMIESSVLHFARNARVDRTSKIAKQFLPYAIFKRGEGANTSHIVLNREYKPLGYPTTIREHFDYDDPIFDVFGINIDTPDIENPDHDFLFLYHPHACPWFSKRNADEYKKKIINLIWRASNGK